MSYQHEHIPIVESKVGFNCLSSEYKSYHKALTAKEQSGYEKYIPRSLSGKHILDLGAGDGRITKQFVGKGFASCVTVDIAGNLLHKGPSWTSKVVADIREPLELEQDSFDVMFVFHVLLHIHDLEQVFVNIARYLAPGGVCIIAHHNERRPVLYEANNEQFKIETYFHSDHEIHSQAAAVGLSVIEHPMDDTCFFILRHS